MREIKSKEGIGEGWGGGEFFFILDPCKKISPMYLNKKLENYFQI